MAIFRVTTSGTFNLKQGAGYIRSISVSSAGTSWTLQINDGPTQTGTTSSLYGGTTPGAVTVNLGLLTPLNFSYGCQIITAGTAGEIDFDIV